MFSEQLFTVLFEECEYSPKHLVVDRADEVPVESIGEVFVEREVHLVNLPICASTNVSVITLSAKISWSGVNFFIFTA